MAAPPDALTVLTLNTHHGESGLALIADAIRPHNPDIAFLQEVLRPANDPNHRDQASELSRLLGDLKVYSATSLGVDSPYAHGDPAILSRFPLRDVRTLQSPDGGRIFAMHATLRADGRPLHFINVHATATHELGLKHLRQSNSARWDQFEMLSESVDRLQGDVIIAGDFNTPASMPHYELLAANWRDFGLIGGSAAATFPAAAPLVRLDYVFGRGEFEAGSYRVLDARVSDHLPAVARLERRKPPAVGGDDRHSVGSGAESAEQPGHGIDQIINVARHHPHRQDHEPHAEHHKAGAHR